MNVIDQPVTDPEIISAVLSGQKECFQELIVRHQKMVYAVAWSQLGNVELSEEAAQQAFVKAFSSLASLKETSKFRSWLATIARNASVSIGRTRRRELSNSVRWDIEPIARREGASEERANLTDELRETVAGLPDAHRQVLTLFYLEDQSIKRVAETLDLTESAVKTRLSRARKLLRHELERKLGDSLSDIAPSRSLVLPIMSALPSLGTSAKLSAAGSVAAGPTTLLPQLGGLFIAMLPAWLLSSRISKQVADDFEDGKENDFRRRITLAQPLNIFFMLMSVGIACIGLSKGGGAHTTFLLIAAFCLWGIWRGVRGLRVNKSSLAYASIACLVLWFVVSLAMGICFLTEAFDIYSLGMTPVALTMFIHFTIMHRYRSETPSRADYNLFLRAATGGLRVEEQLVHNQSPKEPASEDIELSASQLESFAKFLGQHWLISDYTQSANSMKVYLPAIRWSFSDAFFISAKRISRITIDQRGGCELYLSPRDHESIEELTDETAHRAELILKRAMEECVSYFSQGDLASAQRTLCAVEDAGIFKPGANEALSQRQRRLYALTIAITLFLVLLGPMTRWLISYLGLN